MPRTSDSPVSYLLRNPKSKAPTPINCVVRFNNERMNVGTGYKVNPSNWSITKQRIKNVIEVKDRDQINAFLDGLALTIDSFIKESKAKLRPVTTDSVKEHISNYLHPVAVTDKPATLIEFVQWYVDTSSTRLVRGSKASTGRFISPNTIRRYVTTLRGLKDFAQTYPQPLTFDCINGTFYNEFTRWLISKNYATNNVSKYVENVKGFMSAAVDEGLTTNLAYRKFSNLREDSYNVYLNETELKRIYELDLSENLKLDRVRDLFIFASWTGLRFSDFSTLQPENFKRYEDGKPYLDFKQQKTGGRVHIPLENSVVTQLLKKYNNYMPKGISNQKTNDYLKEVCELSEINERIIKHITKGGKQVVKTNKGYSKDSDGVEKWKLISSHTARRSFATNMFKRKMPVHIIMKITGHKKESEFLKYIKTDSQEVLELMREYLGDAQLQ